jgi:hypothetical protein
VVILFNGTKVPPLALLPVFSGGWAAKGSNQTTFTRVATESPVVLISRLELMALLPNFSICINIHWEEGNGDIFKMASRPAWVPRGVPVHTCRSIPRTSRKSSGCPGKLKFGTDFSAAKFARLLMNYVYIATRPWGTCPMSQCPSPRRYTSRLTWTRWSQIEGLFPTPTQPVNGDTRSPVPLRLMLNFP